MEKLILKYIFMMCISWLVYGSLLKPQPESTPAYLKVTMYRIKKNKSLQKSEREEGTNLHMVI